MKKNKILIITIIIFLVILGLLLYFTIHSKNELLNKVNRYDEIILGDAPDPDCGEWEASGSYLVQNSKGNCVDSLPTSTTSGFRKCKVERTLSGGEAAAECPNGANKCYVVQYYTRTCSCPDGYGYVGSNCVSTKCPSGSYRNDSGTCQQCHTGHYCDGVDEYRCNLKDNFYQPYQGQSTCDKCEGKLYNNNTICCTADQTYVESEKRCVSCAANETYSEDAKACIVCKITSVSKTESRISFNETYGITIGYSGCYNDKKITIKTDGVESEITLLGMEHGNGSLSLSIHHNLKSGCQYSKTTVEYNGQQVGNAIEVYVVDSDWNYFSSQMDSSQYLPRSSYVANRKGEDIYGTCSDAQNENGSYTCTDVYRRGKACSIRVPESKCYKKEVDGNIEFKYSNTNPGEGWSEYKLNGKTVTESSKCGACFGDVKDFAHVTNATWSTGNGNIYKYMYPGVTKENCVAPPKVEDACLNSSIISGAKKAAAKTCGEKTSISQKETICSSDNSGTAYYKVDIEKTYSAKVDYEEYSKKPGVGFKYNVVVSEEDTVVATFDKDKWSKLYLDISTENAQYDETNPWYWYNLKRLEVLEDTLNYYNEHYVNWEIRNNKINANLSIDYKEKKKDYTFGYINFIKDSVSKETKVNSKEEITIEVNNKKFKTYNIKQTVINKITLKPERVILNKQSRYINYGEITNPNYQVSGGNKIYITRNINDKQGIVYPDDGTYDISLNVDIDGNKFTNEKCSLIIDKTDLIYRIINVSNPFINKDYKKGVNWLNANYDYTKVIRSDTWSKDAQLVISLTKDEIKKIQQDNDSNWELGKIVYNGRCSLPKNLWSEADKIVCNKINKK